MSRANHISRPRRSKPSRHAGFSVIELLVVIGLIAFLTAAIVAVIPRVSNAAKVAATKATIKKVDEMLNDRINGFRRWIQKQDTQAGQGTPSYVLQAQGLTGGSVLTGQSLAVQKILAQKLLFQAYFPQRYSEINSTQFPNWDVKQNPNAKNNPDDPSNSTDNPISTAQSAACLYLILTKGALFDTEPPSAADLKAIETGDTDDDGIPEVVDAWGHPLRFYRWPTRLVRPGGPASGTSTGFVETSPSPLSVLMPGAAPRAAVAAWQANQSYSLGQTVLSGAAVTTNFMVIYRCVVAGVSGSGTPSPWPPSPVVGSTVTDGGVTWQVLIDPLSVDPDNPMGLTGPGPAFAPIVSEPAETAETWNSPLIAASANDINTFGLYEPYQQANHGNLAMPQPPPGGGTGYWLDALYGNLTNHQQ